ncbi:MAG TPA: TolC family protein [Candidatus Eisenbacteria bacterium]|nr:TolC family protein [Candidatus Eisenbacteria bacterium]
MTSRNQDQGRKARVTRAAVVLVLMIAPTRAGAQDPAATAANEAPRPITLTEAVSLAEKNAPRMVQARGRTRQSAAQVRSGYGAFLPSLGFSMFANRQLPSEGSRTQAGPGGEIQPLSDASYGFTTSANIDIFNGGRRLNELNQAKATQDAAESQEIADRFGTTLDAKQAYFAVLAYREAQIAAQAGIDEAEQQFRAAVARVRAGSSTRSDSLRSENQLRNARLTLVETQNNYAVANATLTRIVGTPHPVTAAAEDTLSLVGIALGEAQLIQLVEAGPDVQVAEAELDAAQAGKSISRAAYLPEISAGYSYRGSGTDSQFGFGDDDFSYNGSLGLNLSFPIFDQFRREEQRVRANVAAENAEANLRDTRLAARENLATFLGAYRTAEQRVFAQTATLSTAEEDLRVQQRRYQVGASTLLDLLTSQAAVNDAREALIRARFDQRVAKAQLEALVGRPL